MLYDLDTRGLCTASNTPFRLRASMIIIVIEVSDTLAPHEPADRWYLTSRCGVQCGQMVLGLLGLVVHDFSCLFLSR